MSGPPRLPTPLSPKESSKQIQPNLQPTKERNDLCPKILPAPAAPEWVDDPITDQEIAFADLIISANHERPRRSGSRRSQSDTAAYTRKAPNPASATT